ncbi:MAG: tetratricopeptide repeat protein, partial [Myxococcales bacterium]|nr:tetratricopeptide repeat protein [Myxococcales bacterium]
MILAETTHLLGHIAGVDFPDSLFLAPLADRPDELRRRAGTALKRILSADADEHPVLFLIDDAEGLDVPTWHILEELCRTQSHFCLMVAGDTAIGPRVTALAASGGRTDLAIDPLSEADVAAMIRILLPDLDSVPDKLVTGLTQKSLGNPSALREMVLSLVEQGLVHDSGNGIEVDLDQLPTGAQAGTLDEAIAARLDRLEPEERFVLACASIVGERFWDRAILAQQRQEAGSPSADLDPLEIWPDDHDADAVQGVLRRLTTKGFVESLGESQAIPGSHEYRFQLDRMRDAVYASQDENTRVARHTAVAKWLAVTAETHREGIAALIAPHLEEAGWLHRAGRAYLEAAAYERARLRTRTALTYIDKALPLIPEEDVVRRIDALHELGTLETILGHYDNAIAAFTEMLDHAYRTGSLGKGGAALSRIARVHRQRGEEERAQSLLERALEMFRKAHDVRGVASTLDDLAQVLHLRGEQDHAVPLAEEALAIRREHGDQHGEAVSLFTLGSIALSRGDLEEADRYFSAALSIHDEVGDRERSIKAHNALGIIAYENDNVGGAIHEWRSALARAREIGARREQCFLLNNIGEAQIAEGHHAEAERALQEARELAEDLTDKRALADIARNQALLALRQDHSNAEAQFEEAMGLAEDYGGLEAMARAHRALGQGRAHREDTAAEDL